MIIRAIKNVKPMKLTDITFGISQVKEHSPAIVGKLLGVMGTTMTAALIINESYPTVVTAAMILAGAKALGAATALAAMFGIKKPTGATKA